MSQPHTSGAPRLARPLTLLLGLAVVCGTSVLLTSRTARAEPSLFLVGMLSRGGQQYCDKSGTFKLRDRHYTVGFVRLHRKGPALKLDSLLGKVVVVRGVANPSFRPNLAPLPDEAPCPPLQRRNDWVIHGGRFRVRAMRPGRLAEVRTVDVLSIQPLRGFRARISGGSTLELTVTNKLPVDLPRLTVTAHYEGCYAKPGSHDAPQTLVALKRGASAKLSWPAFYLTPSAKHRRLHELSYIRILHGGKRLLVDLDLPLGRDVLPTHQIDCRGLKPRSR